MKRRYVGGPPEEYVLVPAEQPDDGRFAFTIEFDTPAHIELIVRQETGRTANRTEPQNRAKKPAIDRKKPSLGMLSCGICYRKPYYRGSQDYICSKHLPSHIRKVNQTWESVCPENCGYYIFRKSSGEGYDLYDNHGHLTGGRYFPLGDMDKLMRRHVAKWHKLSGVF